LRRKRLSTLDCAFFVSELCFELKMGHGLQESIQKMLRQTKNESLCAVLKDLESQLRVDSIESSFSVAAQLIEEKNFQLAFRLISRLHRNLNHLISGLESFSQSLQQLIQFDLEQKTALATSSYQAVSIAIVSLLMSTLGPFVLSGALISFLDLQMYFAYGFGILLIFAGIYLVYRSSLQLKRRRNEIMQGFSFLQCLISHLETGQNFFESWNASLELGSLKDIESLKLETSKFELLPSVIESRLEYFKRPCRSVLERMLSQIQNVSQLPKQLRMATQLEFEHEFERCRFQIKRMSVLSLMPVLLLCFPGSCFLLIGPQLVRAFIELRVAG